MSEAPALVPAAKPRRLRDSPIILIGGGFLALVVLLIAFVGVTSVAGRAILKRDVHRFVETEGTLIRARVVGSGRSGYRPEITFSYEVNGERLTGTNQRTVTPMSQSAAKAVVAEVAERRTLPVFYDPKKPKRVIVYKQISLETSEFASSIGILLVGLVIGAQIVIALIRRRRETTPT